MSSFEKALNTFVDKVNASCNDLGDEFIAMLRKEATSAFMPLQQDGTPDPKKKKALSGYNLFMREYKTLHPNTDNLLKEASVAWSALGDAGKLPYNEKAKTAKTEAEMTGGAVASPKKGKAKDAGKEKKTRPKNGWELYYADQHAKNKDLTRKEIGETWKAIAISVTRESLR